MNIEDYDYELPEHFIAQTPLKNRCDSKLLLLDKNNGNIKEDVFKNIANYLVPGDVLVLNDTKVIPARIIGEKEDTKAVIELLLLKDIGGDVWECLAKPAKRLHEGTIVSFKDGLLKAEVVKKLAEGIVHVKLIDQSRYQTVYAENIGSAAAPTAGLHFTKELLDNLKEKGIEILYVTLHVGLGTFRPVEVSDITKHHMHSEYYVMSEDVANRLNKAKEENKNIYAVGTTSTRVLETVIKKYDKFIPCSGNTDIFIYPGYKFGAIDGLITNFHLPKSTLLMLVSALSKKEYILNAYEYAKMHDFRFFSFGDAMFIKKL